MLILILHVRAPNFCACGIFRLFDSIPSLFSCLTVILLYNLFEFPPPSLNLPPNQEEIIYRECTVFILSSSTSSLLCHLKFFDTPVKKKRI